ncbi:hypothetical protein A6V39_03805 [Candidatus Mycoplasma haematobovis]|uniref:Uncharacterized protein n=1 Tax=Candidatus Mycoplasma haematobovis TaxID=432608 RepID=A0A1A9QBQ2_9MOLU|nr:hypothetical protein [Candidatus Mycoplasma haematobovis]OAL10012.1 hypothetical protein A6V39_03805 [Candidatus Mycoplasma haematobovis]
MNTALTKTGMGILSAGAIGSAGYGGYVYFSKDSFASKLGVSVLNLTSAENKKEWEERIKELTASQDKLDSSLDKTKVNTWDKLRDWCNANKSSTFNKDDIKYKNFSAFCTWKIGDKTWDKKILATVNSDHANWKTAHTALKRKTKTELSKGLQKVWEATDSQNANKVAMHKWCTDAYKNTWTGDNDATLKEVKEYCKI